MRHTLYLFLLCSFFLAELPLEAQEPISRNGKIYSPKKRGDRGRRGKRGHRGKQGRTGPIGDQGPAGSNGAGSTISSYFSAYKGLSLTQSLENIRYPNTTIAQGFENNTTTGVITSRAGPGKYEVTVGSTLGNVTVPGDNAISLFVNGAEVPAGKLIFKGTEPDFMTMSLILNITTSTTTFEVRNTSMNDMVAPTEDGSTVSHFITIKKLT